MANLNKVQLMGNLTRDPELRHTPRGTAVAEISIAINRSWRNDAGEKQEDTTFVDVTFWGKTAELAQKYLAKGRGIYIEGRLQLDTWEDKESGKKRSKLKIVGETLQFLPDGKGGDRQATPARSASPQAQPAVRQGIPEEFEDDDIPF
jgi:single-strand DNA-binding protein